MEIEAELIEDDEEPRVVALARSEAVVLAELRTKRAELWTGALETMAVCGLLAASCNAVCG